MEPKLFIQTRRIKHNGQNRIGLFFAYNDVLINRVRKLPHRKYSSTLKCWHIPDTPEAILNLISADLPLKNTDSLAEHHSVKYYPNETITKEWINKVNAYEQYLKVQRYSPSTIKSYIQILKQYLAWHCRNGLESIDLQSVRSFNHEFFVKRKNSRSYQNIWINALKLFLKKHTDLNINLDLIERPRKSNYLPDILSEHEARLLINSYKNLKHRAIIMTYYACGLRKSELINLKISDIDGNRKVLRIRHSKGAKDRDIAIPDMLLKLWRDYFNKYKPNTYLFNGRKGHQYSASSIDKLIKRGVRNVGIQKKITAHSLRHSYATHLVERNINLRFIQEALGHRSSKTTEIYTRLSKECIANMVSPIDFWTDINRNTQSQEIPYIPPDNEINQNFKE